MQLYFAYGSNMSRSRLEARVGAVIDLGWSSLRGYRHEFNKRGADGTAKGNIVVHSEDVVHGIAYRMAPEQMTELARFEGGYRTCELEVEVQQSRQLQQSVTFVAVAPIAPGVLAPSAEYLGHYETGMREHGLPVEYIERLLGRRCP